MRKIIIHLSDLHFRHNWDEGQGIVLDAFFKDLTKQVQQLDKSNIYLVFSGDIVLAGEDPTLYEKFFNQFDAELTKLGILKSQRICIPGNHDVAINHVKGNFIEHNSIISSNLSEKDFNDYISKQPDVFKSKFNNYCGFASKFAAYGISMEMISGAGWDITEHIGIYCLNTAIFSSGGHNNIDDKTRLAVDTRNLQKWILGCKANLKILIMHHPIEWLTGWAQIELNKLLRNSFSLCLSGHVHDQSIFHSINSDSQLVECSAPPLLTNKEGKLGYSMITVAPQGVIDIQYRQWTSNNSFVTGVDFSNTDNGKIIIKSDEKKELNSNDYVGNILTKRWEDALRSFSSQPIVWVDPVISKSDEISKSNDSNDNDNSVIIADFISNPKSTIITAPPQFGLTSLAHYLAKEAWLNTASLWLYIDTLSVKWHSISKDIEKELDAIGAEMQPIKCIILDSWTNLEKDSLKLLKKLCELYKDTPIVVMQTVDELKFANAPATTETIDREFDVLYLLALPRGHIRKVVSAYNDKKHIGDEDTVITKVVTDLEVLNIHRTPLNCLTILKVSEKYFDESPVNRTKLLEMVLFLLFDMQEIPTYKVKPDLKDCEYVLGRFCEKMIRASDYSFSREYFLKELQIFCNDKLIDLEIDVVFDVLHSNNIIVKRENQYCFRFSYWIYYFAALRMHRDEDFVKYIFDQQRYASFPEIVEFYTGIDRNRADALKILIKDIKTTCDIVNDKVGLPDDMNPYRLINWRPSPESIQRMQLEIGENVLQSNLPDEVKDRHADIYYDPAKPYNQSIQTIFHEFSLVILMQSIKASSRALRNSDYVDPEIKRELLFEIMRSWEQLSKVLLALTPLLAITGNASFGGAGFTLYGDFGETIENRLTRIIQNIPSNIVNWFRNDLFSHKMGPLLFDHIQNETNDLKKHELIILLIYQRPRDWKSQVEGYIGSISKNSFYLFDTLESLSVQYSYGFASPKTLHELAYLMKMCLAKHEFGNKKPGIDAIKKIPNSILPKREKNESTE